MRITKKFIEVVEKGEDDVVVWGTGKPTRGFLYVEDAAEGILLAIEKYNKSDPVNLGTNLEISIKDLAELIAKFTGFKGKIKWDTSKPNGQPRRRLDTTKVKKDLVIRLAKSAIRSFLIENLPVPGINLRKFRKAKQ